MRADGEDGVNEMGKVGTAATKSRGDAFDCLTGRCFFGSPLATVLGG